MSIRGDVGVVVGGVRGFVGGGCVGDGFPVHGVSVVVAKESLPLHRPLLLPTLPAERCETSTFSVRQRRHLPVLLPVHTTTQLPPLRERHWASPVT